MKPLHCAKYWQPDLPHCVSAQTHTLQMIYINGLLTLQTSLIDLSKELICMQRGARGARSCLAVTVLPGSQGDGTRQRHGDGCRVPVSHHLFINLKSFTYNSISEDADVFFSLYDTREAKQIRWAAAARAYTAVCVFFGCRQADGLILRCLCSCSEKFMVKLNKNGGPKNPEKVDRLCALFTVTQLPVWTWIGGGVVVPWEVGTPLFISSPCSKG